VRVPGPGEDEELLLDEQILGVEGLCAAAAEQPGDSGQKVEKK
jgi:hypothetical protein